MLDIYEYYSFALLFQVATRNDLIGCDSLVYQMLLYMKSHGGVEDNIFSSDYIWQVYLVCCGEEKYTECYFSNRHMSHSQLYDLIEHLNEDFEFHNKSENEMTPDELDAQLKNENTSSIEKKEALTNYLISIYIHGKPGDRYFVLFGAFLSGDKEYGTRTLLAEMQQYGLDKFWLEYSLHTAEYQLHELGFFGDRNKFRNHPFDELIIKNAHQGSFEVTTLVSSALKLANHECREVDISSLAYCWSMYYNRKDYSVSTIDEALLTFEAQGLISWKESFSIIDKLMDQSEKGISHLLTSYLNKKGADCVNALNETGYFNNKRANIRFWDLNPEYYDCFNSSEVLEQVMQLLSIYHYSRNIEYDYIQNIMKSKHRNLVLCSVKQYDYAVLMPDEDIVPILEEKGVKYVGRKIRDETKHIPLQHGSISIHDFEYIAAQKIGYLEISQYADGWYSCLPFVDVFSLYPKEEIQQNYISIIHNSMFARVSDNEYIGNWNELLGNIPAFLSRYGINVNWEKIYDIFNAFLDVSLIYRDMG